jgi:hypothetical protein
MSACEYVDVAEATVAADAGMRAGETRGAGTTAVGVEAVAVCTGAADTRAVEAGGVKAGFAAACDRPGKDGRFGEAPHATVNVRMANVPSIARPTGTVRTQAFCLAHQLTESGGQGIRTLDELALIAVFKTAAIGL